jgi:eukaryotic-like serine/threonine-protein kinase
LGNLFPEAVPSNRAFREGHAMDNDWFDSVDEDRRQKFEAAWLVGDTPGIDGYLPPAEDPKFIGTLEELVHIDMEFRWKRGADTKTGADLPDAASYLERFPALNRPEIAERLLQGEFEFRHRFGDRPAPTGFLARCQQLDGLSDHLRSSLEQIVTRVGREARPDRPGDQLGHYKLIAEHGRGGFGAVWRAEDSRLGRRIAIKRLSRQISRSAESRRRFLNEARITARLEHPGIVPVYDISNTDEEAAYYAMKLVRGKTLAETIRDFHDLPDTGRDEAGFRRLLSVFLQVCQTIRYCHDAGVLHRDLKPHNVIVGSFGESIVLDWGLASFVDEPGADSGIKGTPAYMAPEQAAGDAAAIGIRTDVYGLGAMLYHILTGQPPLFEHAGENGLLEEVRKGAWTEPIALRASAPKPLVAICKKAMALAPQDRYETVSSLAQDVENYLADLPVSAFRESWTARTARWMRRHPTTIACGILAILFAAISAIAGLHLWQQRNQEQMLRIAEVRRQAERADAMAFAQLQAGRYDSAAGFWTQASELLVSEPSLADSLQQVEARRKRAKRIDEFYRLSKTSQERMFFDQLREAAIYSQAALERVGALDHADWRREAFPWIG